MRQREWVILRRNYTSPSKIGTGLFRYPKSAAHRSSSGAEMLLGLQRTHGNAFVQRLVQRKLAVSQPRDSYEQEANRVADAVVEKNSASSSIRAITRYAEPGIHRMCTECEEEMQRWAVPRSQDAHGSLAMRQPEEQEEEKLQRQVAPREDEEGLQTKAGSGGAISTSGETENSIRALQGGGQPLPESVRSYIEPRMGNDFSGVRIHKQGDAAQLARSVNALAFTVGRDIVFGQGQYRPETGAGKRLLAHELTHVVQQRQPRPHSMERSAMRADASTIPALGTRSVGVRVQRLVRRSLLAGCGPGQNPFGGDRRAAELLTNALARIDAAQAARPGDPANADVVTVGNAMRTAFRLNPTNDDNWNLAAPRFGLPLIRRRLAIARDYIDSVVFTFNCCTVGGACPATCGTCAPGEEAFVCGGESSIITLCPLFWTRNRNQRGRVLVHEVLHIDFGFINDWGQPDRANAHCYAQFTALVNGFNSPAGFRCH
jgi:hypothetical protein